MYSGGIERETNLKWLRIEAGIFTETLVTSFGLSVFKQYS